MTERNLLVAFLASLLIIGGLAMYGRRCQRREALRARQLRADAASVTPAPSGAEGTVQTPEDSVPASAAVGEASA